MAIGGPTVTRSATGQLLAQGPPGDPGPQGLPGPNGATGAPGTPGAGSQAWLPVTRGMTMSLQASRGVNVASGTNHVIRWYDQAPPRVGQSWYGSGGVPNFPTTGTLNGQPAVVCPFQSGQGAPYFIPATSNVGGQQLDTILSSAEFSFGAAMEFTGTSTIAIGQDLRTVYEVFGEILGGSVVEAGLAVGISSAGFVKFLAWINDSGTGSTVIDGVNVKGMISAAVPLAAAHTVMVTFSATTGIYSLYVDNLAAVSITGVGPVPRLQTPGGGTNGYISNNYFDGGGTFAEIDAWNVCLTPTEIATMQAWLNSAAGI